VPQFFALRNFGLGSDVAFTQIDNTANNGDCPGNLDAEASNNQVRTNITNYILVLFNCVLMIVWVIELGMIDNEHYYGRLTFAGGVSECYRSRCFLDEFSLTHFSHGFVLLYYLAIVPLRCCSSRSFARFDWLGFHGIVTLQILWELLENSEVIVAAFRRSGPNDADYYGDSLINSIGDQLVCWAGYACMECIRLAFSERIAMAIGIVYFLVSEVILYFWICDGFLILWLNLFIPGSVTCTHGP